MSPSGTDRPHVLYEGNSRLTRESLQCCVCYQLQNFDDDRAILIAICIELKPAGLFQLKWQGRQASPALFSQTDGSEPVLPKRSQTR